MSYTILLAVDGSEGALRAARHVARLASVMRELDVHVVNVQPPGDDWMVRRMFKAEEIAKLEQDWGNAAIASVRPALNEAGVACVEHVVQGDVAKTVARLAQEFACDQIVMGTQGRTALGDVFLGSEAIKVLHLTRIPVTLVK